MIAGVFGISRSVAVIMVACLLIVDGVTGAALSSWARHNPVAAARSTFIVGAGKSAEAGPPNAMGFAPVLMPALAAVVNISSSRPLLAWDESENQHRRKRIACLARFWPR
jgi:hypothetical protein